jgi:Bacterial protein of unknown function (DUF899)
LPTPAYRLSSTIGETDGGRPDTIEIAMHGQYRDKETPMNTRSIASPQEWEAAREELLVKEMELTRARDALAAERRRMPWLAVEKESRFEGPGRPGEPARSV